MHMTALHSKIIIKQSDIILNPSLMNYKSDIRTMHRAAQCTPCTKVKYYYDYHVT